MNTIMQRLTSRKFLLALAAFLTTAFADQPIAAAVVASIYVLAEAGIDAVK